MIKKLFSVLIIAVVMVIPTSASSKGKNASPKSLLIMGDSISTGYGLENYDLDKSKTSCYANLLAKEFSLTDTYKNTAVDGMTSAELLDNLNLKKYDDYIKNSDVIIVSIGGNDAMDLLSEAFIKAVGLPESSSIFDLQNVDFGDSQVYKNLVAFVASGEWTAVKEQIIRDYESNFKKITTKVYELNPHAVVIYQNVYNPFSGVKDLALVANITDTVIEKINEIISNNCAASSGDSTTKYEFVDVYSAFNLQSSSFTNISDFDIHPNAEGHKKIYELCKNVISESPQNFSDTSSGEITPAIAAADSSEVITSESNSDSAIDNKSTKNNNARTALFISASAFAAVGIAFVSFITVKKRKAQTKNI